MRQLSGAWAAIAFLALALAGCATSTSASVKVNATATATVTKVAALPTITPTATAQPTPDIHWIPLKSQSPADIIVAAKQSDLFQFTGGDSMDLSHLGTPALVVGLSASNGAQLPDYYDIPVLDASGVVIGVLPCELNADHTAINLGGDTQYGQPHPNGSLAGITAQQALTEVSAQHHVSPKAGTQPHLIYFPFNLSAEETGQINWNAGGDSPSNPMWEIDGADGKQHFAGDDGHAYYWSDLPLAPSIG